MMQNTQRSDRWHGVRHLLYKLLAIGAWQLFIVYSIVEGTKLWKA